MTLNLTLQKDERQKLLVETSRVGLFLIVLAVSVLSYLTQPSFINWGTLAPFYGVLSIALCLHLFIVSRPDALFGRPGWLFATFVIDSILISALISSSGMNQSLFLFLHLVNILLAGLVFRTEGGLLIGLLTSLFFTTAALLGPEIKAMNFIMLLAMNNVAFFLVAGLSGYLSDQLDTVGGELQKTGLSLKSARDFNRLVLENIPSGLMTFDARGLIIQANPAVAGILEDESLEGKNIYDLLKGFEPREAADLAKMDLRYQAREGAATKLLGLTTSGFASAEIGEPIRVALVEDLTKVRELEWGLRQAEKMAAVGQLAAGIAHEIRNPLAGISGSVELLSQTASNEDDRKLMAIILREIARLNNLITEFLDYSRPETPPTDPVDLVPLISEIMDSMGFAKDVRHDIQTVRELPVKAMILGRREKLQQAFLNIILNGYQAMGDTLRPMFEVRIAQKDGHIEVRLKDNGSGMTENTRKKMFEPFHTTKPKGTGLGLAVTHKILEGHGARIFVESVEGQGTEFRLVFPAVN